MVLSNGCATCNCGTVKSIVYMQKFAEVEVMGKGFSSHPDNIVSVYVLDGVKKIEISFSVQNGRKNYGVTFYENAASTHSYRYNSYGANGKALPERYWNYAQFLEYAYRQVFGQTR